jgi:hypothetical protein
MLKQKVFFFAAPGEGSDMMCNPDDLLQMAVNHVNLYGEGCLNDPETPTFIRQLLVKSPAMADMQKAG